MARGPGAGYGHERVVAGAGAGNGAGVGQVLAYCTLAEAEISQAIMSWFQPSSSELVAVA